MNHFNAPNEEFRGNFVFKICMNDVPWLLAHPPTPLERQDRLRKHPFAGFSTVIEDITRTSYTKNQPILLASQ